MGAKDAGLYEMAIDLANRSASDPRTLIRAARDYAQERPECALPAAMPRNKTTGLISCIVAP
jgi:hypothetical protein